MLVTSGPWATATAAGGKGARVKEPVPAVCMRRTFVRFQITSGGGVGMTENNANSGLHLALNNLRMPANRLPN